MTPFAKLLTTLSVVACASVASVGTAHADEYCGKNRYVDFKCDTKDGKEIKVCTKHGGTENDTYTYTYGKKNAPEITLTDTYDNVAGHDNLTLNFKKGDYFYVVYGDDYYYVNNRPNYIFGGLRILKDGKQIRNINCATYASTVNHIDFIMTD